MSRVHPAENKQHNTQVVSKEAVVEDVNGACVLTVWKKSSMSFQGTDGFTVFNSEGRLAFRVDNYSRKKTGGLVLMDGTGRPLLTLRPKILSLQNQWNGFKGDDRCGKGSSRTPVFSMIRRRSTLLGSHDEVQVFTGGYSSTNHSKTPDFRIEGSFRRRCCSIRGPNGEVVAEITRKKVINTTILLSDDVFSLVVHPGFNSELAMAFVIIMDRICHKPFTPILCST